MRMSLEGKLFGLLAVALAAGAALGGWLALHFDSVILGVVGALLASALPLVWVTRRASRPARALLRALAGMVASYRDGDFSFSIRLNRKDELGDLVRMHNELGTALREQRQQLAQRELLLETVTQQSPVALLLVDSYGRIVYSNLAARHLVGDGSSLQGRDFDKVLDDCPAALREAVAAEQDNLFPVQVEGEEEIYHLSQRPLLLRGRPHRLLLLKCLTRELSRQEVAAWKKLIRVLSHELNNSLGPITSLVTSGEELVRRGDLPALPSILATIGERAAHLHRFVAGYAAFARLPTPRPENVRWSDLIDELHRQADFKVFDPLPESPGWVDRIQVEQLLINLLKNARESGSDPAQIELNVSIAEGQQRMNVRDRGCGMSETVLAQALLPFYSTKRNGSGLGLALAREIAEAHGGQIRLTNRPGGGLEVCVMLPDRAPVSGAAICN
jgi:two-component system, NtrC family, nitrogen regulation sensor histidine kinase NtrY